MPGRQRLSEIAPRFKTLRLGLAAAAVGLAVYFLPFGLDWEESTGLEWLFALRGPRPAPADVMLVSIDKTSADRLGLANDPARWPRELHARVIDRLAAAGATVVGFDVYFKEPRDPAQDRALAEAVRRAGNVVLFSYLKREVVDTVPGELNVERIVPPFADLARAAAATAPFALPKVPVRVSQFWTFQTSAGDAATLPVAALELYAAPAVAQWLRAAAERDAAQLRRWRDAALVAADETRLGAGAREALRARPDLLPQLQHSVRLTRFSDSGQMRRVAALLNVYGGESRPYLNFYGPPRTVTTVPYADVLAADARGLARFKGKVVLVGFAENRQPEQKDGFFTVYSQANGVDLSGVEIAATAIANLLDGSSLKTLSPIQFALVIIVYGFMIAGLGRLPAAAGVIAGGAAAAGGYLLLCHFLFDAKNIWLPWMVPVFVQTPLTVFAALLWRYRDAQRGRQRIHRAFSHYLPRQVVDHLAEHASGVEAAGQLQYGVCLATDAERYTRLAESLSPAALSALMNKYYEVLFAPVRSREGIVSDVIGDAMLAVWSAPQADAGLRARACAAALDIARATARFNREQGVQLRTRIGLHAGEVMIGNIGAMDHYEYRAVGDIVNTASRIQGINKHLGTEVIASREVFDGVPGLVTRDLGRFLLAGKEQEVSLAELMGRAVDGTREVQDLCAGFAQARAAFLAQEWGEALALFQELLSLYPDDGPGAFYLKLCRDYVRAPPRGWTGVIGLVQK